MPSPKLPTKLPPAFVNQFDRLLTPRLERLCMAQAYLVQCNVSSFGEAMASVWAYAWRMGAGFLSDRVQGELREWIRTTLIQHIDAPTRDGLLTPEQALRLFADIDDTERKIAGSEGE